MPITIPKVQVALSFGLPIAPHPKIFILLLHKIVELEMFLLENSLIRLSEEIAHSLYKLK